MVAPLPKARQQREPVLPSTSQNLSNHSRSVQALQDNTSTSKNRFSNGRNSYRMDTAAAAGAGPEAGRPRCGC